MANYSIKHDLYQTVLQTFYEEFDTEDQDKWESLVKNAREQGADESDLLELPSEASDNPEDWFYLYRFICSTELSNQETDEWISEINGTTEIVRRIVDANGKIVVSDD